MRVAWGGTVGEVKGGRVGGEWMRQHCLDYDISRCRYMWWYVDADSKIFV